MCAGKHSTGSRARLRARTTLRRRTTAFLRDGRRFTGGAEPRRCSRGRAGSSRGDVRRGEQRRATGGSTAQGVQALGSTRRRRPPAEAGGCDATSLGRSTHAERGPESRGSGSGVGVCVTPADFASGSAVVEAGRAGRASDAGRPRAALPRSAQAPRHAHRTAMLATIDLSVVGSERHKKALDPQRMRAADSDPRRCLRRLGGHIPRWDVGPWLCVAAFRRVCLCRSDLQLYSRNRPRPPNCCLGTPHFSQPATSANTRVWSSRFELLDAPACLE